MKKLTTLLAALACFCAIPTVSHAITPGGADDPDPNYDRLDGTGSSGKRVDVIEWEGNLEIHVYPKGSLRGLGLKLDKRNKSKPVMVIAYRFTDNKKDVLIRRAILGIDMYEGFKTFKDPTEAEFDKIIISNNGLSGQVTAFKLDAEPTQLYPDGHPALKQPAVAEKDSKAAPRKPAAADDDAAAPTVDEDTGSIRPFFGGKERK